MKDNGKTVAIVSYITIIGWIVSMILYSEKKTALGGYHLRQTLLLYIFAIALGWIPVFNVVLGIVLFIFWLMGLIGAINEKKKEIPLIGPLAQKWFKGL